MKRAWVISSICTVATIIPLRKKNGASCSTCWSFRQLVKTKSSSCINRATEVHKLVPTTSSHREQYKRIIAMKQHTRNVCLRGLKSQPYSDERGYAEIYSGRNFHTVNSVETSMVSVLVFVNRKVSEQSLDQELSRRLLCPKKLMICR
jgi:hypothetical protein